MSARGRGYKSKLATLRQLNLVPPDTAFNRRAAAYAKECRRAAEVQKQKQKYHAKKQKSENNA